MNAETTYALKRDLSTSGKIVNMSSRSTNAWQIMTAPEGFYTVLSSEDRHFGDALESLSGTKYIGKTAAGAEGVVVAYVHYTDIMKLIDETKYALTKICGLEWHTLEVSNFDFNGNVTQIIGREALIYLNQPEDR